MAEVQGAADGAATPGAATTERAPQIGTFEVFEAFGSLVRWPGATQVLFQKPVRPSVICFSKAGGGGVARALSFTSAIDFARCAVGWPLLQGLAVGVRLPAERAGGDHAGADGRRKVSRLACAASALTGATSPTGNGWAVAEEGGERAAGAEATGSKPGAHFQMRDLSDGGADSSQYPPLRFFPFLLPLSP